MGRGLIGVQMMMLGSKVQEMGAYTVLEKLAEIGYHCIEISQIAMTPKNVSDIRKRVTHLESVWLLVQQPWNQWDPVMR